MPIIPRSTSGLGVPLLTGTLPFAGSTLYAWLIPVFAGLELWVGFRKPAGSRDLRWLGLAAGVFLIGLVIWRLSHTGAPLCYPASLVQGHAIWHLLCAVSTAAIFVHYQSERDPPHNGVNMTPNPRAHLGELWG